MEVIHVPENRVWPGSRGKVTAHCLWTACKAIAIGICLILIGATMATLGYYAHELSIVVHVDGNKTTITKDISKDYHLNNLTYIGPVVMGIGGFLIVATCVMTFEARDSAAKVVPARIKRVAAKLNTSSSYTPSARSALTSTFVQFSRTIQTSIESRDFIVGEPKRSLRKCPSAPALVAPPPLVEQTRTNNNNNNNNNKIPRLTVQHVSQQRLNPNFLPRQAISVDNPSMTAQPHFIKETTTLKKSDSDVSMAMDLYLPDCSITLHVQDESRNETSFIRRGETVKRRPLLRQEQVETHDSDFDN